jgi:mono/diheme cytochrome c family protein
MHHRIRHIVKSLAFGQRTAVIVAGVLTVCSFSTLEVLGNEASLARPGEAATLSYGGRLYDNHWIAAGRRPPNTTQALYPNDVTSPPVSSWRCVGCHGWDYHGSEGHLGRVLDGFASLSGSRGKTPETIVAHLRSPSHRDIVEGLPVPALDALAKFIAYGLHDVTSILTTDGKALGDPKKGKDIYEGACSRCHEADGKAPLYGEQGDLSSLGWLAKNKPEQAIHKIRNGINNADMLALRFLEMEGIGDLLSFLQSLDEK